MMWSSTGIYSQASSLQQIICTVQLAQIMQNNKISYQNCSDNTQIHVYHQVIMIPHRYRLSASNKPVIACAS